MPRVDLFRDCPGYAEAARRERDIRDVPFLGLPERVCGRDCAPLTLRRLLWLQMVNSPFLSNLDDAPTAEAIQQKPDLFNDLVLFFWITSPAFEAGNTRKQKRFFKSCQKLLKCKVADAVKDIKDYMDEAMMDAGEGVRGEKSFYSNVASVVSFFRKNYGLDCDVWENSWLRNLFRRATGRPNPLDIPLKIVWQLMRTHRVNVGGETIFTNKLSDAAVKTWLRDQQPAKLN